MNRKDEIARTFSAAPDYHGQARVQSRVAAALVARLADLAPPPRPRILEVGCGTGFLSRLLIDRFPDCRPLLTDISAQMLTQCARNLEGAAVPATFLRMDGEQPPPDLGPFDLIASNLALQWFDDPVLGISRLASLLAPGGSLHLTTLGAGTFREWRDACDRYGAPCGAPDYPPLAWFEDQPIPGFVTRWEQVDFRAEHPSARAFVHYLKTTGTNMPRAGHRPANPAGFRRLLNACQGPFPVTYAVLFVHLARL